jgi:hypothetical protein
MILIVSCNKRRRIGSVRLIPMSAVKCLQLARARALSLSPCRSSVSVYERISVERAVQVARKVAPVIFPGEKDILRLLGGHPYAEIKILSGRWRPCKRRKRSCPLEAAQIQSDSHCNISLSNVVKDLDPLDPSKCPFFVISESWFKFKNLSHYGFDFWNAWSATQFSRCLISSRE